MRARRKLRTRYFHRSSSVWMTMRPKLVFGSISPVISSTFSICFLMRSLTLSIKPSCGQLYAGDISKPPLRRCELEDLAEKSQGKGLSNALQNLRGRSLCHPRTRQGLQVAVPRRQHVEIRIRLPQYIVDVHCKGEVNRGRISYLVSRVSCIILISYNHHHQKPVVFVAHSQNPGRNCTKER
jgi:hypothetical protein